MTVRLSLNVNDSQIKTDDFVAAFIDHTVSGIIESLEGTGKTRDLNLTIEGDKVNVNLNGELIATNVFASKIIRSTIMGMIAPLKGVAADVKKLTISIQK